MKLALEPARCPNCPTAPGLHCAGTDVPRLCELVDPDHPAYNPAYLPLLTPGALVPGDDPRSKSPSPDLPNAAEMRSILNQMYACPYRESETDCGCGGLAHCGQGRGRGGLVNHHDCISCLRTAALY